MDKIELYMLQLELIFPNCLWFNTTHIFLYALSKTNGILADCSMHFHDGIERETIATRLHCIYFDHHIYVRKKKTYVQTLGASYSVAHLLQMSMRVWILAVVAKKWIE